MAVVQFCAARLSYSRTVSPCTGRLVVWTSLELVSSAWMLDFAHATTFLLEAPGSSIMASTTTWCGRNKAHWRLASCWISLVAMARTVGSLEHMWDPALAAWIFLYTVTRWGRSRPPLDLGRKRWLGSADPARPLHLLRYLVAMGCRVFCSQEMGKSVMERFQVKRGQMQALKTLSFCCCVMGVASIFSSMTRSLATRCSLLSVEVEWIATGAPRNLKVLSPR